MCSIRHVAIRQWFGQDVVQRIADTLSAEPAISRRSLSRRVCEWLGWNGPGGRPQELSCRKVLAELERSGHVEVCHEWRRKGRSEMIQRVSSLCCTRDEGRPSETGCRTSLQATGRCVGIRPQVVNRPGKGGAMTPSGVDQEGEQK